jgi:hypothetical protein
MPDATPPPELSGEVLARGCFWAIVVLVLLLVVAVLVVLGLIANEFPSTGKWAALPIGDLALSLSGCA